MTALDKTLGKVATKVIAKYGSTITLKNITTGSYNPSTGSSATTTISTVTKAVVEDYKPHQLVEGLILASDKKFTIAAAGIPKPKAGDEIILKNITYVVPKDGVEEIWSGEEIAAYEVRGRI